MKETETTDFNRENFANKLGYMNQDVRSKLKDLALNIGAVLESDDITMPESIITEIGFMIGEVTGNIYKTIYEYMKELRGY